MNKKDFGIIYLFLALGGKVTVREHNLFSSIMKHEGYDESDIKEVGRNTMSIISGYYNDEARESIIRHQFEVYFHGDIPKGNTYHNRNVLWTLINLGFSDSAYSKAEQRLVHLYAKNMNVPKSYVLEMEDTAKALLSLNGERKYIEASGQKNRMHKIYQELDNTQRTLQEHISALVSLG